MVSPQRFPPELFLTQNKVEDFQVSVQQQVDWVRTLGKFADVLKRTIFVLFFIPSAELLHKKDEKFYLVNPPSHSIGPVRFKAKFLSYRHWYRSVLRMGPSKVKGIEITVILTAMKQKQTLGQFTSALSRINIHWFIIFHTSLAP